MWRCSWDYRLYSRVLQAEEVEKCDHLKIYKSIASFPDPDNVLFSQQWQWHFLPALYFVLLITWSIEFSDCGQLLYRCISLIYLPFIPPRLLFPFSGGRVADLNPPSSRGERWNRETGGGIRWTRKGSLSKSRKTTREEGNFEKECREGSWEKERRWGGRRRFCDSRQREAVLRCQPAAPSGVVKCIRPVHWEAVKWLAALQDRS